MSIQTNEKDKIFNDINITPLTDIFLVLLIIMMVIAPMFQTIDKNIKMPEINSGINVEDKNVTVSITKNADFFVNSESVAPEKLESKLKELISASSDKNVVVKADTETKSKEIMKVLNAAQVSGYEKLTIAGEPLSKKQQEKLKKQSKTKKVNLPE